MLNEYYFSVTLNILVTTLVGYSHPIFNNIYFFLKLSCPILLSLKKKRKN